MTGAEANTSAKITSRNVTLVSNRSARQAGTVAKPAGVFGPLPVTCIREYQIEHGVPKAQAWHHHVRAGGPAGGST